MTIEPIKMPQLGESVTEGTISKWLVAPGDIVQKYEPIAEILTDKVNTEIPSSFSGIIKELLAKEDATLAVGEVICLIDVEQTSTHRESGLNQSSKEIEKSPIVQMTNMKSRYSPAVLKLSQEYDIDLSKVSGSGKEGRITRKDLLAFIESNSIPTEAPVPMKELGKQGMIPSSTIRQTKPNISSIEVGDIEVPVNGVRKAIAANMVKSKQEVPHAWMMVEVDATNLVKLRNALKNEFLKKEGYPLTYFAFFIKAVAQALSEFPQLNSMWAGDKIIQRREINLSIAVATEDALFVPVIKHADEKTIKGIAREMYQLAEKTREGKLSSEEIQGGTFTVNNTGTFGSVQSMGIINYPQAAILQVEQIIKRPVIKDDMIAVRSMVNLCLSIDHRVLDGLVAGRFLVRVKQIIEEFNTENTSIY